MFAHPCVSVCHSSCHASCFHPAHGAHVCSPSCCALHHVCEQRPCTSMGDSTCFTAYINLSARVGRFIPLCLPVPVRAPCVTVQAAPCACVCNAHACALQAALPTAAHARAPALPPDPEQGVKLKSLLKGCKPTLLSRFPCFSNCQCLIIP